MPVKQKMRSVFNFLQDCLDGLSGQSLIKKYMRQLHNALINIFTLDIMGAPVKTTTSNNPQQPH